MQDTMASGFFSIDYLAKELQSVEKIQKKDFRHLESYLVFLTNEVADCDENCLEIDTYYQDNGINRTAQDIIKDIKEVLGRE